MKKIRDVRNVDNTHEYCEYCNKKTDDLRPYGKDGAWICYQCGMKPENRSTTDKIFSANLNSSDIFITG